MSYKLILSVLLSAVLMLAGCTTNSSHPTWWNPTWHSPWHKKAHSAAVPTSNQTVNNSQIQTPYVYSNHMPPYTRVGTPYTVTSQPVYPIKKNNSALPYTYSYNMPPYTRVGTPYATPPELNPNEVITQNFVPSYFDSVEIDGTLHTIIKGGQVPCIRITGPRYALKYVNVLIMNNVLIIRTVRNTFGVPQRLPVSVEVDTSDIQNLTINGNGTTVTNNIGAQGLNLNVKGNGALSMTGSIVLYQLNAASNSHINIYWVNSNNLIVHAGNAAKINLAGVATNLEATLSGDAVLDAKYLRSQVAYVKTRDYSCVWVYVSQSLSAYANDYSDIYYYPDPLINGPFYVHDHGSIMRMAGLPY